MNEKEQRDAVTTQRDAVAALRIPRPSDEIYDSSKRRMSNAVWLGLAAVLLVILIVLFRSNAPVIVEVAVVTTMAPSQADAVLTASGYVVAQRKAAVASKGTGRLESLNVEEGDRVQTGQIIARLEHADVEAGLAESRARADFRPAPEGDAARSRVVVKPAAIVDRGGRKVAFVVRSDAVLEVPVELGGAMGDGVEVRHGLAPGDRAVLNPPERLRDGIRVKIKE